ncbi:MAG TPA: VOC family protein [Jatrophihabitans sp.]|jgi:catechol 2,3-dioxygenase-like lactoylglutathione lyase family enzyme|uniref:VOC family protein n=1 Tax=Jatrophihabitans sp. TaxID=1932789 RepID=UPI002F05C12F
MTAHDSSTAPARFKDLCLDAVDAEDAARFWSTALGLRVHRGEWGVRLVGPSEAHTVWVNTVPEPKTVKNRVHLDVHTRSLDELTAAGALVVEPEGAGRAWTVMSDPDGQEFCAFIGDEAPEYRLYELVIDCAEPEPLARWWASVLGGELQSGHGGWWLSKAPGVPFEYLVFVPVPEAKTVKNRVHWDVEASDPQLLVDAGATLLRPRGGDIGWHVLADPAGNEFCVFQPTAHQDGPSAG